jgi:6-phosphogluconolactonase (cycloisomerase 2 family)
MVLTRSKSKTRFFIHAALCAATLFSACTNPLVEAVVAARSAAIWSKVTASPAAGAVSSHAVTLTWPDTPGATGYNLYWSTNPNPTIATATKITGVSSPYVHSGLTNNINYSYFLTAIGPAGESGPSAVISALPIKLVAYVTSQGGVKIYPIDSITGAFGVLMPGGPSTGYNLAFSVNPECKYAYLTDFGEKKVYTFGINSNTGALTAIGSPVATGSYPQFIVVNANSSFVYVANAASNGTPGDPGNYSISGYKVSSSDGSLSLLAGCPWSVGDQIGGLSVSPDRRFLYMSTNAYTDRLYGFGIDTSTGALSAIGVSPTETPCTPGPVVFDSTSGRLYLANQSDNVDSVNLYSYPVNPTSGVLGSPVSNNIKTNSAYTGRNIRNNYLSIDPKGRFLFVGNRMNENSITVFRISNGALSVVKVGIEDSMLLAYAPGYMTVDALGNCLYVANGSAVQSYSINQTTGALTSLVSINTGSAVNNISVVSLP